MHNTIILGTGRSGTSMLAACFRNSGVYFGDELIVDNANPFGYYESTTINQMNDRFIFRLLYPNGVYRFRKFIYPRTHEDWRCFWAVLPMSQRALSLNEEEKTNVQKLVENNPFCFKDPRFNATLPTWMAYLPEDIRFVIVFRCPLRTVDSTLRIAKEYYNPELPFERQRLFRMWIRAYLRLIKWSLCDRRFMIVDSEKILEGEGRKELESFVDGELDFSQVAPEVRRSSKQTDGLGKLENHALEIYSRLRKVSFRICPASGTNSYVRQL